MSSNLKPQLLMPLPSSTPRALRRDHVRLKYDEVGVGMEVPPELPRPLRVGQAVTARHPATRQLHDGQVLTVKGSKYR